MIVDLYRRWRQARLETQAAAWVIRVDEDRNENEERLRRWVGSSDARADAYNEAYRAFHGASSAAQQIYAPQSGKLAATQHRSLLNGRSQLILALSALLPLATAGSYFVLTNLSNLAKSPRDRGKVEQRYTTRVGEVRSVQLADGSRLVLDTDTEIRVLFTRSTRQIEMIHGRARFDVAHDTARAFSVAAKGMTINDRGTIFDVEAYRVVRIRLLAGSIDISLRKQAGDPLALPLHLVAGQQVRLDPALVGPVPSPTATPPSDTQWVTGMKTFDDVPVKDILEEANRYSTTKLSLEDAALESHHVFLDVDIRNTHAVAGNLALYLKLRIDSSTSGQLILRKIM